MEIMLSYASDGKLEPCRVLFVYKNPDLINLTIEGNRNTILYDCVITKSNFLKYSAKNSIGIERSGYSISFANIDELDLIWDIINMIKEAERNSENHVQKVDFIQGSFPELAKKLKHIYKLQYMRDVIYPHASFMGTVDS